MKTKSAINVKRKLVKKDESIDAMMIKNVTIKLVVVLMKKKLKSQDKKKLKLKNLPKWQQ